MPERKDLREEVAVALAAFLKTPFPSAARQLFGTLGYETATWLETIRAGWRGAWTLNPLDPLGSLLDEAMRRAEIHSDVFIEQPLSL